MQLAIASQQFEICGSAGVIGQNVLPSIPALCNMMRYVHSNNARKPCHEK